MNQKKQKKNRTRWRILSSILALCVILTIMPATPLWAAEETPETNEANEMSETNETADEAQDASVHTEATDETNVSSEDVGSGAAATDGDSISSKAQQEDTLFPELPDGPCEIQMQPSQADLDSLQPQSPQKTKRYTVLVLDTSSKSVFTSGGKLIYTADTAIEYVKESANKFISDVHKARSVNHIAIVEYKGDSASVVSPFSTDLENLSTTINGLYASKQGRNIADGLQKAEELLDGVTDASAIKNVVLFTTGHTNAGQHDYNGHYNKNTVGSTWYHVSTDINLYAYANCAYRAAESLKKKATVYSVGLFQTYEDMPDQGTDIVQFFKLCALDFATSSDYFYDVRDPEDLKFVFGEIVEDISGIETRRIGFYPWDGGWTFGMDMDWGWDLLLEGDSEEYDNRLAKIALALSGASERSEDAVEALMTDGGGQFDDNSKEKLDGLGCDPVSIVSQYYKNNFWDNYILCYPAVSLGHKSVGRNNNAEHIITITIRGTKDFGDGLTDLFSLAGSFSVCADNVYSLIETYIETCELNTSEINEDNVKFFITGHSLGGAVANLVARRLNDDYGVQNVFAYTFAAPKAKVSFNYGQNQNMFNILNSEDIVPLVPPIGNRYGNDIWFSRSNYEPDIYHNFKSITNGADLKSVMDSCWLFDEIKKLKYGHAIETYMSYLIERDNDLGTKPVKMRVVHIHCPVDVEIYVDDGSANGLLVGRVANNKVDDTVSNGVYVQVDGDEKTVYLLYDGDYTFRLTGTDTGTMKYSLQDIELNTNEVQEEKVFDNVALTKGKEMTSRVDVWDVNDENLKDEEKIGIHDVELLVLDNKGKAEKKVLSDGKEVPLETSNANTKIKIKKLKITGSSKKIAVGKKLKLKAVASPANATNKAVTWKSSNTKYATVNSKGIVTIKKAAGGKTVTITAMPKDGSGIKATYKLKCMKGVVKKVTVPGKKTRAIKADKSIKLRAKVTATKGANKALKWKSSNKKYATVNSKGKVTVKKAGKGKTVKITAIATDGSNKKATVKLKIK